MADKKTLRDTIIKRYYTSFAPKAYDAEKGEMPDLVANDQNPAILFISCIDSRVAPSMIFKMRPGEFFNHRHIAGLVPEWDPAWANGAEAPSIAATVDFAVNGKNVDTIIIKGHTLCGGVKAYVEGSASPLVKKWMDNVKPAIDKLDRTQQTEQLLREAERECVKYSYKNLIEYPAVKAAMAAGTLTVEGWIHDIENGQLFRFDPQTDDFVRIEPDGSDGARIVQNAPKHNCSH